jgi:RNA polymerase sigma-70 factor (ECF subfamily)
VLAVATVALLASFALGDPDAATAFIRRYQGRVYGLARAMVGALDLAEDVAQEAFLRAWKNAQAYDSRRGSVHTWMLVITRSLAIDAMRLRRAQPEQLAAELALGTVSGAERAGALDHLARCAACREPAGAVDVPGRVYGDNPTWLVVSLDRVDGSNNSYSVETLHEGSPEPVAVGTFTLQSGHDTFARALELGRGELESVRVLDAGGRVRYTMTFEA